MERVSMEVAGRKLELETGRVAKQANGSAWVRYGDTVVLATICMGSNVLDRDFFPLSVEYREKFFAAGKIPGGFLKREGGRPRDREILISRLVDRPLRPLFDKRIRQEIQVFASVLSADNVNMPDTLGLIGASMAACLSDIPFAGPVGAVIVGLVDGKIVINPTREELVTRSAMELVVAGTADAVVMVEGELKNVPEDVIVAAFEAAHQEIRKICALQTELLGKAGKEKMTLTFHEPAPALVAAVKERATALFAPVTTIAGKKDRGAAYDAALAELKAPYAAKFADDEKLEADIAELAGKRYKELMRLAVLDKGKRIDGRKTNEIRKITSELGVLPRTHGSALFTRGETQALATLTLGTKQDEQRLDDIEGEGRKRFMLHYNFPPFSTGEVKRPGTSRREIGHGNLAERALQAVVPGPDKFPYTVRIVSDITESNGSSSMASICGGCLALMDGGVPITEPVAGIAMGLIKEGDRHAILSDILGTEDALGDMDFKVAGTATGINALQMDIKIKGLPQNILREALEQARQGRLHILGKMKEAMATPRATLSPYAPRIVFMKISVDKIGALVGPGGKMIRSITEEFGVKIDIDDDGTVTIASADGPALEKAQAKVAAITEEVKVGQTYRGKVVKIMDFGAFIEVLPGTEGLCHISELDRRHVKTVGEVVKEGDTVVVKCIGVDPKNGKIKLSRKAALPDEV